MPNDDVTAVIGTLIAIGFAALCCVGLFYAMSLMQAAGG